MKKFLTLFLALLTLAIHVAVAETITLGNGAWLIGEDIPAGHYKITKKQWGTIVMCDVVDDNWQADLDASTVVRWLDTKSEYVLKDGLYLCISSGRFSFTPITLTYEQEASNTYKKLLNACHNAMWNNYEDKELHEQPVPDGTYRVGVDIPSGNWCIRYFDTFSKTVTITQSGIKTRLRIYSPAASVYTPDKLTHTFLQLKTGDTITIESEKGNAGLFFIPLADYHIK